MKTKRTVKRRKRLEGEIAKAAKVGAGEAMTLATYGCIPTLAQRIVWNYLSHQKEKGWKPGVKTDYYLGGAAYPLCQLFLDAVNGRDLNALRDIATAVKNPQLYEVTHSGPEMYSQTQDSQRRAILYLKRILDWMGKKWTVKQLAGYLEAPVTKISVADIDQMARQAEARAPQSVDGYSALRRLAKSLNFPLAKDK